jgi:hypothetical protein
MRRQLAVNSNSSAQDMESIQTMELLGEGTFGKVYKGLWRGSVVAVSDGQHALLPGGGLRGVSAGLKRHGCAELCACIYALLPHHR